MSTTSGKFPWSCLPADVKTTIFSYVPLYDMLDSAQNVFPEAPFDVDNRIRSLQPLWAAWVASPMEVRNVPRYRKRSDRLLCSPADFCRLERLVLGSSRFVGKLSAAVAELAYHLKVLHLDENHFTHLPLQIIRCQRLLLLDCSHNSFRSVPDFIVNIKSLKYLSFANNSYLTKLPQNLGSLLHIVSVNLQACALTSLPTSLISRVVSADKFYLHVTGNNFPPRYIERLVHTNPTFKRKLTHMVSVDVNNR